MLERAGEVTREGEWMRAEHARYGDDLVILVVGYRRHTWWLGLETGSRRTNTGTKLQTADTAKGSLRVTVPVLDLTTLSRGCIG